jgi:hypothetical protein
MIGRFEDSALAEVFKSMFRRAKLNLPLIFVAGLALAVIAVCIGSQDDAVVPPMARSTPATNVPTTATKVNNYSPDVSIPTPHRP